MNLFSSRLAWFLAGLWTTLSAVAATTVGGPVRDEVLTRGALWLCGLGLIAVSGYRERRHAAVTARDQLLLRKLHHAVEQSASGLVITDAAGSIEYANPRFCAISGYDATELIGRNPRLLRSEETHPVVYADMWTALAAGRDWRGELRNRRKDGTVYWCLQTISPIRGSDGRTTHYVGVAEDVSERKRAEETIHHLAFYDALTDLPNRRLLRDRLEQALAWGRRAESGVALLYLDLDRFKTINDTLGHAVGDTLLVTVARRLSAVLRENDTLARLGGDEFAVVLGSVRGREEVALVAQKLVAAAQRAVQVDAHELHVTASIGIALFPDDAADADTLVKAADAAMYRTKAEGKNGFRFYANDLGGFSIDRLEIENGLRQAVARGELTLDYQPKQDLASGRIYGVEALVRWNHPRLGRLEPMRFIPVAEELGLIADIGGRVIAEACRRAASWRAAGHELNVAVNLSPLQLHQSDLLTVVDAALEASGLPAAALELEITESALIGHRETAEAVVRALRARGVSIAIDDFGAGYSSLSYLRHFPVAVLKVDQSFIQALGHSPADDALVRAIIVLASGLGLTVVAEGVETEAQRDALQAMGCHLIQGAWLAHPLAPDELSARLAGWAT